MAQTLREPPQTTTVHQVLEPLRLPTCFALRPVEHTFRAERTDGPPSGTVRNITFPVKSGDSSFVLEGHQLTVARRNSTLECIASHVPRDHISNCGSRVSFRRVRRPRHVHDTSTSVSPARPIRGPTSAASQYIHHRKNSLELSMINAYSCN